MKTDLTLELLQSQLPRKQQPMVDEEIVQEIQKLAEDPDYGPEFLDSYMDHLNILRDNPGRNPTQYLNAVKFFSLVEMGNSLTDAYIKVFPDRFENRTRNSSETDPNKRKAIMRGEASRYNATMLVGEIRKVATVPVQLIHRHLLHEAIMVNADLMYNARSEMVRQKAADTLIRELKPAEDVGIKIDVKPQSSVIEDYEMVISNMVKEQQRMIAAGGDLMAITNASITPIKIINPEEEEDADSN